MLFYPFFYYFLSLLVLGADISLYTLLSKTLLIFSCYEMRHQKLYKFFHSFSVVAKI